MIISTISSRQKTLASMCDSMSTKQLIAKLHDEIVDYCSQIDNLTSVLRVCCLRCPYWWTTAAFQPLNACRLRPSMLDIHHAPLNSGNQTFGSPPLF